MLKIYNKYYILYILYIYNMEYEIFFFSLGVLKYTSVGTQLPYVKYHLTQSCVSVQKVSNILKL